MEKLTLEQEIQLVKSIRKFIAHGSSRAVFFHPFDKKLAIKIAIGDGGKRQSEQEIMVNSQIPEYTNTIHAYGRNIIVCDRIERNLESHVDNFIYGYDWVNKKLREEEKIIIQKIVDALTNVNGDSGDNHQIGMTVNGKIVAYDYGFCRGRENQVDYWNDDDFKNFPKMALEQLRG